MKLSYERIKSKLKRYKVPLLFSGAYIFIIILFAGIFTLFFRDDFYHSTVQYESSTKNEYNEIKDVIEDEILHSIHNQHPDDKVFLDDEGKWFLFIKNLYVENFSSKDEGFILHLSSYILANHNVSDNKEGFNIESPYFNLNLINRGAFDKDSDTRTLIFSISEIRNQNSNYDLFKIFDAKSDSDIELTFNSSTIEKIISYTKAMQGFPNSTSGVFWRMLYLSMVTITTLGFGDIVPLTNMTRVLVGMESVIGIILIGWLANALLSAYSEQKMKKDKI